MADNIELIMRFHPVGGEDVALLSSDFAGPAEAVEAIARALNERQGLVLTHARYNREAEELETLASDPHGRPRVTQAAVPRECRLVEHLDTDVTQIRECLRLGAATIASLLREGGAELKAAA